MGDAGPPTPLGLLPEEAGLLSGVEAHDAPPPREVKVLVTGFGVGFLFSLVSSPGV